MDDKTFDAQTAQDWIAAVEKPGQGARDGDIYPMLRTWLAQSGAASVVDIGCGQGICADKVAMQGVDYTGIDPSPLLIARAQEIYARDDRQFIVGNAYALPCGDAAFDAAFSVLVWHLLEDLPRAAEETARVIRPGGSFMCITANPSAIAAWQAMYAAPIITGKRLEGVMDMGGGLPSRDVLYFHTQDEIAAALSAAGLVVDSVETFRAAKHVAGAQMLLCLRARKPV